MVARIARREVVSAALSAVGGFLLGWWAPRARPAPELPTSDIGAFYHEWSKPSFTGLLRASLSWGRRPSQYKAYPNAKSFSLPRGPYPSGLSVEEAIARRRSIRDFSSRPMSLEQLSQLLFSASGITEVRHSFRAAPSAGALYPIELYPIVNNVAELERGIYHYVVREHQLELVRQGDFRQEATRHALGQEMVGEASLALAMTAIFQRTRWRYAERTYRYVLLEAGHIAQNVYLSAVSQGLGCCAIGAFYDDDFNRLLGVDGKEEAILYLLAVGTI